LSRPHCKGSAALYLGLETFLPDVHDPESVEVPTVETPIYFNAMADRAYKLNPFCPILDKVLGPTKV
jgi:hypothetical protein